MPSLGLFKRKEIWLPTLRGWVMFLLLIAIFGAAVLAGTVPFLAPVRPVHQGILIVEGWLPDYALAEAKKTFENHPYRFLVVTGIPIDHGFHISAEKDYAHLARNILKNMGMNPEAIVPISCPKVPRNRTFATAREVRAWLDQTGTSGPVDVLTLGVHARRTWLLYATALGERHSVGIIAAADQRYDPGNWWRTSSGFRTVTSEIIAYLYAKLFFFPETPP